MKLIEIKPLFEQALEQLDKMTFDKLMKTKAGNLLNPELKDIIAQHHETHDSILNLYKEKLKPIYQDRTMAQAQFDLEKIRATQGPQYARYQARRAAQKQARNQAIEGAKYSWAQSVQDYFRKNHYDEFEKREPEGGYRGATKTGTADLGYERNLRGGDQRVADTLLQLVQDIHEKNPPVTWQKLADRVDVSTTELSRWLSFDDPDKLEAQDTVSQIHSLMPRLRVKHKRR